VADRPGWAIFSGKGELNFEKVILKEFVLICAKVNALNPSGN
jgi:hypothetical protein